MTYQPQKFISPVLEVGSPRPECRLGQGRAVFQVAHVVVSSNGGRESMGSLSREHRSQASGLHPLGLITSYGPHLPVPTLLGVRISGGNLEGAWYTNIQMIAIILQLPFLMASGLVIVPQYDVEAHSILLRSCVTVHQMNTDYFLKSRLYSFLHLLPVIHVVMEIFKHGQK